MTLVSLYSQGVQTPLRIKQSVNYNGKILLEEARANGTNTVGISAPDSVVSDIEFKLPGVDGSANNCIKTDGSLNLGWRTCGDILQGGNSFSAAMIIGTNDNNSLYLEHNNVSLVELGAGGIDLAPVSVSGFYTKVKKLEVKDYTGGAGFYEYIATATASASSHRLRDNAGSKVWEIFRTSLTVPVNYTYIYSDLLPAQRATADGDAVDDPDPPSLGSVSRPWYTIRGTTIYGNSAQFTAGAVVGTTLTFGTSIVPGIAGAGNIGTSILPVGSMYTNDITIDKGSPVVGQVWTATSTAGDGAWETIDIEDVTDYDWSQTITAPGAAGTHTITLTPGPLGVIASETSPWYAISGTPGADEYVQSTGTGTCDGTGQASCTIQVITANTHSGTTTMRSASDGSQEAIMSVASGERVVLLYRANSGGFTFEKPVYTLGRSVYFKGEGWTSMGSGSLIGVASGQTGIYHADGVLQVEGVRITGDNTTIGIEIRSSVLNGSQVYLRNNWFEAHTVSVKYRTASDGYIERNLFRNSAVCLDVGNELWGDTGGLYIRNNYFGCTDQNIALHEMGNTSIQHNSFLGSEHSIDADFRMVVVNTSGTTVTATGDYVFGIGVTTGVGVYINGVLYTVSSRDSATQLTLTSSAGTQSGVDLAIGSGQLQIQNNNFDNQEYTSIRLRGGVKFGNIDISGNHFQRVADTVAWDAISITNENIYGLTLDNNTIDNFAAISNQTRGLYATALGPNFRANGNTITAMTYAMYLDLASTDNGAAITGTTIDGVYVDPSNESVAGIKIINGVNASISNTNIRRHDRGIIIDGSSTSRVRIDHVSSECATPTDCTVVEVIDGAQIDIRGVYGQNPVDYGVKIGAAASAGEVRVSDIHLNHSAGIKVSASVATQIIDLEGTTYANLPANAADHSQIACTDCKVVPSTGACQASGNGALAVRLNGAWNCQVASGNAPQWEVNGGDIYISTDANYGLGTNNPATRLHLGGGSAGNSLLIAHGTSGNYLQLSAESTYASVGTYASADFLIGTNSSNKWRIAVAGHLTPEANNSYNLGDPAARILNVYTKYATIYDTLTLPNGAVSGYVLTSDGSGNASWAASASGLPVADTTSIVKGSADASKLLRFEVDGFTTATTRVLIPQNASYTIAGLEQAQTFTVKQTVAFGGGGVDPINYINALELQNTAAGVNGSCMVLSATDVDTTNVYGAGRICGVYTDNTFNHERLTLQTATGSGTYTDALVMTDGFVSIPGTLTVTGATSTAGLTITGGNITAFFGSTYNIGGVGYTFATLYIDDIMAYDDVTISDDLTVSGDIIMGSTTLFNTSRNLVGMNRFGQDLIPSAISTYSLGDATNKILGVYSNYIDVYTDLQFNGSATFTGNLLPSAANTYSLGASGNVLFKVWTGDLYAGGQVTFPGGAATNYLLKTDSSGNASWTNAISIATGTFSGAITANGGIATASGTNSTIYTGSGSIYIRTFSGGDANCSGVTDGWIGIRTDTLEVQACVGGAMKKAALL